MSAAAILIYKMLIARGVSEEEARQVAEEAVAQAADIRLSENLQAAKTHADQAVVKSEEKADAKFVSQTRFHELDKNVATRGDIAELRRELCAAPNSAGNSNSPTASELDCWPGSSFPSPNSSSASERRQVFGVGGGDSRGWRQYHIVDV